MKKLRSCDTPLTVMKHLPMDYPDLPMDWGWAEIAKLQAAVLKEAVLDVLDQRIAKHEGVWRWIISRRESQFSFPLCAEAFERVCTDAAYRRYSIRLLAAAVTALHEGKASRRMAACIWRWARNDGELPFSFKACCAAYGAGAEFIRANIEKLVRSAIQRKTDGAAQAA